MLGLIRLGPGRESISFWLKAIQSAWVCGDMGCSAGALGNTALGLTLACTGSPWNICCWGSGTKADWTPKSPGPKGFEDFGAVGVRMPELSMGHDCWPYVAAWLGGRRAKGLLLCSVKKGLLTLELTTELVAVRSTNWFCEKSSQMEASGEKMPWVEVVGDIKVGVSRMAWSRVCWSSKEKALGFRSLLDSVDDGLWKSM